MAKQEFNCAALHSSHFVVIDKIPVLQRPVDERTSNLKRSCLVLIELVVEKTPRAGATSRKQKILADLSMLIGEPVWVPGTG